MIWNPLKNGFLDGFSGKILADSGYVSRDLYFDLMAKNLQLIAKPRKSMLVDNAFGFGYLPNWEINFKKIYKNRVFIEHFFYNIKHNFGLNLNKMHSHQGFFMNLVSCLLAFQWKSEFFN
jgi:hypothetical protein